MNLTMTATPCRYQPDEYGDYQVIFKLADGTIRVETATFDHPNLARHTGWYQFEERSIYPVEVFPSFWLSDPQLSE